MKPRESLPELIQQATQMFMDIDRQNSDLIYFVAKMDNEERAAMIIAYQNVFPEKM